MKTRTALNRKVPIQVAINLVLAVIGINTRRFIENKNETDDNRSRGIVKKK